MVQKKKKDLMGKDSFLPFISWNSHLMPHFVRLTPLHLCLPVTGQKWLPYKRTEAWVICLNKGFCLVVAFFFFLNGVLKV